MPMPEDFGQEQRMHGARKFRYILISDSTEQELEHKFKLVDAERGIYRCIYCEAKKTLA